MVKMKKKERNITNIGKNADLELSPIHGGSVNGVNILEHTLVVSCKVKYKLPHNPSGHLFCMNLKNKKYVCTVCSSIM